MGQSLSVYTAYGVEIKKSVYDKETYETVVELTEDQNDTLSDMMYSFDKGVLLETSFVGYMENYESYVLFVKESEHSNHNWGTVHLGTFNNFGGNPGPLHIDRTTETKWRMLIAEFLTEHKIPYELEPNIWGWISWGTYG